MTTTPDEFVVGGVYLTRDGEQVRIVCIDRKSEIAACIVGLLLEGHTEFIYCWRADGRMRFDKECPWDLMPNVPTNTEDGSTNS
jgi:hypothetical protein